VRRSGRRFPVLCGGRTWWAHVEFTRMNIEPTILRKKIEDVRHLGALVVRARGVVNTLRPPIRSWRRRSISRLQAKHTGRTARGACRETSIR
jgi:hypothetical protein